MLTSTNPNSIPNPYGIPVELPSNDVTWGKMVRKVKQCVSLGACYDKRIIFGLFSFLDYRDPYAQNHRNGSLVRDTDIVGTLRHGSGHRVATSFRQKKSGLFISLAG